MNEKRSVKIALRRRRMMSQKRLTAGEQTEYTHTGKKQFPTTKRKEGTNGKIIIHI